MKLSNNLQLLPLLVIIVAAIVLFYRIGDPALKNWDEAIYAQVAKEIFQSGDWLTLHWQHANWLEKPPLTFWIMAGHFHLFGVSEFSARAVSALAGVGVVTAVYGIGRLQRGPVCGLIAALILLTTFQFVQMSRLVNTDVLLLFFIYLAIYGYLRVRNGDRRWWYVVSVSCALGFMVKSFAVLFAPAAIALALIIDRDLVETVKARHFWFSILAALAVILPWHATMIYLHGSAFFDEYFYYHVWSRTVTPLEGHRAPYWFYLNEIWLKTHPWWSIAPFAVVFAAWQVKRRRSSVVVLALIVFVFGFFTVAQTKSTSYILPVYPALALLIADLFTWLWDRRRLAIRMAVILVCVWFAYEGVGKIRSYYVRIEQEDEAVKELASLAAAQSSPPVLIVYSRTREFDPQGALFYSNKLVLQASGANTVFPYTGTLYHRSKPLADVTGEQPSGIILTKDDLEPLLVDYAIEIVGQSHNLVYAKIRKKELGIL
jgi:4-amino-4-deoxy-L-arabinose transferase-like glycosyltransferase